MALVALVLIVDRARAAAGNRSDRRAWSASRDSANGSATRRTNCYSLHGSANPMPPMIPVINDISDHRGMR